MKHKRSLSEGNSRCSRSLSPSAIRVEPSSEERPRTTKRTPDSTEDEAMDLIALAYQKSQGSVPTSGYTSVNSLYTGATSESSGDFLSAAPEPTDEDSTAKHSGVQEKKNPKSLPKWKNHFNLETSDGVPAPMNLERQSGMVPPGAFRSSNSRELRGDAPREDSTSHDEDSPNSSTTHLVEATLVLESETAQPPPSNDPPPDSNDIEQAVAVKPDSEGTSNSNKRFWLLMLAAMCLVTVGSVAISVTMLYNRDQDGGSQISNSKNSKDSREDSQDGHDTTVKGDELVLREFPRVTHHVAVVRFDLDNEHCRVRDEASNELRVTLSCGDPEERRLDADAAVFAKDNDPNDGIRPPPGNILPRIVLWNETSDCVRVGSYEMLCTMDGNQPSTFLFSCGTNAGVNPTPYSNNLGPNGKLSRPRITAEVEVEDAVVLCANEEVSSSESDDVSNTIDSRLRTAGAFVTVGRLCTPREGGITAVDTAANPSIDLPTALNRTIAFLFRTELECSPNTEVRGVPLEVEGNFSFCVREETGTVSSELNVSSSTPIIEFEELYAIDTVETKACNRDGSKPGHMYPWLRDTNDPRLNPLIDVATTKGDEMVQMWRKNYQRR